MRTHRRSHAIGATGFFRLTQSYDTLQNFYVLNFNLWKHHGLDFDTIDNMLPYERDIYTLLVKEWLEEEKRRQEKR